MFELIKADRHTLDAAADFRCEGAGFIEKYKPFSYDENKLVIRADCAVRLGGYGAALVVNRGQFVFDPADHLDSGRLEIGNDYYIYV